MVPVSSRQRQRQREVLTAYLLLSPTVLLLLTVLAYPLGWEVWASFTSLSPLQEGATAFVGLDNYRRQLGDPQFWRAATITIAYAAITSEVPGEVVAAAVGWARPEDPTKNGVIMEFHDKATREEAERMIVQMLEEAFWVRGETIRDMQVFAVEHRVERTGCALAAVTLLSDDDLV